MSALRTLAAAAILSAAASASSAVTLDFDTGTPSWFNDDPTTNRLVGYEQGGYSFSISQTGDGSIGANLFNTADCDSNGGSISGGTACAGNDDGDLVPRTQGENGVKDNVLIRQETGTSIDDDAATSGRITFTYSGLEAFFIRGFSAVDEQPMSIEFRSALGTQTCGPVDNRQNRDTGSADCTTLITHIFQDGDSFDVVYAGSGGVDSIVLTEAIQLTAVPLPASLILLLSGFGSFAVLRRRRSV